MVMITVPGAEKCWLESKAGKNERLYVPDMFFSVLLANTQGKSTLRHVTRYQGQGLPG
ncbi:MAG: hypothetical protein JSS43_11310 [Proteobacteria bacterium]|nr:hypothetical protein [Pseudomonadota bacterium]